MVDDPRDQYLQRLGGWRVRRRSISVLADICPAIESQRILPMKQAGRLVALWRQHVPEELASRTALRSFRSGVLRITVADAATQFYLDRLLRKSLLNDLRAMFKGNLRSVKLEAGKVE